MSGLSIVLVTKLSALVILMDMLIDILMDLMVFMDGVV